MCKILMRLSIGTFSGFVCILFSTISFSGENAPHELISFYGDDGRFSLEISTDRDVYQPGDQVNILATIKNNDSTDFNLTLNITAIEQLGRFNKVPSYNILFDTSIKDIFVPANESKEIRKSFILPTDLNVGDQFSVEGGCWEEKYLRDTDRAYFEIKPHYTIKTNIPEKVHLGEEVELNLTITNTSDSIITNIKTTLLPDEEMISLLSDNFLVVERLNPNESIRLLWRAKFVGSSFSGIEFKISSDNGGNSSLLDYIKVLMPPKLINYSQSTFRVEKGQPFNVSFELINPGDFPIESIEVKLDLPEGVTTDKPRIINIDSFPGRETRTYEWSATTEEVGVLRISVCARDITGKYSTCGHSLTSVESSLSP